MGESIKDTILAKFQQLSKDKEELSGKEQEKSENSDCKHEKTPRKGYYNNKNDSSNRGKRRFNTGKTYNGPITSLPESAVGITEYVTPSKGFSGIIKHRFSDFQVHEIDKSGKVVILDSTDLPEAAFEDESTDDYKTALTEEQWADLEKTINSDDSSPLTIEVTELDKAQRTFIHKAVKAIYGAKVCSNSVKEEEKTFIKIGRVTKNRERLSWPANQGRFLHFTVFKENLDTSTLVNVLSRCLRTKPNTITFAGTKDKRAKTTQRMCVKNRRGEQLKKVNCFKAHFGNFSYYHNPLRLGDLSGNKFTIAIRNVTISDDEVGDIMKHVQSVGFINYFGLQRFGSSPKMPTHCVGKLLLLEDWKEAVNAILTPKDGISSDIQDACEMWAKTKNSALAFSKIERKHNSSIEGRILGALKKLGNNFYDALFALPRNSILLYLHAYQSYVWNKVVSRRIREFGHKPIGGDLIYIEQTEATDEVLNETDLETTDDNKEDDDDNSEDESDNKADMDSTEKSSRAKAVKKLTEDEAKTTPFTEIVYPLPGNDVEFPANVTEKWYFEVMEEDGISMDNFTSSKKVFSMYGTYRKVLNEVRDLEWKIVKYKSTNDDLIQSDWEKFQGRSLNSTENDPDANYKGVVMDFSLNSSSYATMLLREVMKCDTSSCYHANLTQSSHSNGANVDEPPEKQKKNNDEDVV